MGLGVLVAIETAPELVVDDRDPEDTGVGDVTEVTLAVPSINVAWPASSELCAALGRKVLNEDGRVEDVDVLDGKEAVPARREILAIRHGE